MDIAKIDQNMKLETSIDEADVVFCDVRQAPFEVYGLYDYQNQLNFQRLPDEIAKATNEGVNYLYRNTAGGRVRFCTDSRYVAIHAEMPSVGHMDHMAMTGSSAFDLYLDDPESEETVFYSSFRPSFGFNDGYERKVTFPDRRMRYITINFPSYSHVTNLYIGLQQDATLGGGMKYKNVLPVVYYGSSITQGGCSSRPGNAYQNVISQRMNMDFINLGFSGSGKGEDVIVDYMATLQMSAFVSDYDHNAPTVEHLQATHCKLYQKIRAAHPDIPYIMVSRPNFNHFTDDERRRDVIVDTFRYARENGDRNVYYIDGESMFRGPYANMCTVDGCHPTDVGFALMADSIGYELQQALFGKFRRS